MKANLLSRQAKLTKGLLALIAILLAFLLLLIFIWLWYDIRITSLDKTAPANQSTPSVNH
jgi:hypothetical protein